MITSIRRRLVHLTPSYETISRLLFVATMLAWLSAMILVTNWRHGLMVNEACKISYFGDYSQSEFCFDTKGLQGWSAAAFEAVPFAGFATLAILGVPLLVFRKQLDLTDRYGERLAGLVWIGGVIATISVFTLCGMGVIALLV